MSRTPEGAVKAKVAKQLKELGAYYFYPATGGFGRNGVPDIVGCYLGLFFAFECKAGRGKPTQLQIMNIQSIQQAKGLALVINEENANEVKVILKTLAHHRGEK